ncbi:MAG: GIY-YIG nuclease family protein [Desulfobulbaceae bacterium]|jgi:putative endonuclease|nr:GIY-YIG nuclease family protein [Desulfobulbaceae bacterium]
MAHTNCSWFVYILACADHSLYTGVTTDLGRRLHEHNYLKSGAKYTRNKRPVTLVYSEGQPSRSTACRREYEIKRFSRKEKLHLIHREIIHEIL